MSEGISENCAILVHSAFHGTVNIIETVKSANTMKYYIIPDKLNQINLNSHNLKNDKSDPDIFCYLSNDKKEKYYILPHYL